MIGHGSLMWTVGAFIVALGILIVVHELGHYLVARAVGVKVLRFSVGFGRPLWSRRLGRDGTEWCIAAFPLGGYVKMLDEREAPVAAHELERAFNRQSVGHRALVVVAGPLANLLLAILLYWAIFIGGHQELRPILAAPPAGTPAAHAGVEEGESVLSVSGKAIATYQEMRWEVIRRSLDREPVVLELANDRNERAFRTIDTGGLNVEDVETDLMKPLGLLPMRPRLAPEIGQVVAGSVAELAGLKAGDLIVAVDAAAVDSWLQVARSIREAPGRELHLIVDRNGAEHEIVVVPKAEEVGGQTSGRIGVAVKDDPDARARLLVFVRYGPVDALSRALAQTWEMSSLTLRMIGRMVAGELSWKNISGPVTIADYAGQSAQLGLGQYLKFIALISISLGVLNLLPIPVLDGGHLLYYLIEVIKGGPLSERAMEIGQQIGMALLALLMAFAFYNDINRLISG